MQTTYYPETVMYYLSNLPNAGCFDNTDQNNTNILVTKLGNIEQGVVIKLFIKYNLDNKKTAKTAKTAKIEKFKYLVYGDGYIIATLAKLSEELIGKKLNILTNYSLNSIISELEIPDNRIKNIKLISKALQKISLKLN